MTVYRYLYRYAVAEHFHMAYHYYATIFKCTEAVKTVHHRVEAFTAQSAESFIDKQCVAYEPYPGESRKSECKRE